VKAIEKPGPGAWDPERSQTRIEGAEIEKEKLVYVIRL